MTIFIPLVGKVLLDIISEYQNIRALTSERHYFFTIEVPNFIIVVLSDASDTFIRRTEYALVVSAARITKSFPLIPMSESI